MHFWNSLLQRFKFWWDAIRHTFGFPLLIAGFLWTLASFIRDEFVPDEIQGKYQIFDLLPSWNAGTWCAFLFLLVSIILFEAGFRADIRRRNDIDQLKTRLANLITPAITILYREGDTRYLYTDGGKQVIAICLFNGSLKTIDNMEIYSNGVIPIRVGQHNLTLRPRVSSPPMRLSPGEEHYVPIVWFTNDEFETIRYESGAAPKTMQGEEFLMKVVVVGRDMQAARKQFRFGVSNGEVYAAINAD